MSPAELELHFQEERINFEKTEAQEHKLEKELAVRKATAAAQRKSEAASHGHAQKLLESINRAKAAIVKQELAQTKEKLDTERETLKLEYKDGLHPLHPLSMEELLATLAPTAVPTLVPTADPRGRRGTERRRQGHRPVQSSYRAFGKTFPGRSEGGTTKLLPRSLRLGV